MTKSRAASRLCVHCRWDVPDNITQDWTGFLAKKRTELERLHGVYDSMLKKAGCDMFIGRATVVDPHTVEVDGKRYTVSALPLSRGRPDFCPAHLPVVLCMHFERLSADSNMIVGSADLRRLYL